MSDNTWKHCSSCKKSIEFGSVYWVCSVSTCQRSRTGLYFCTVGCWDAHLGSANHREAWAEERRAPSKSQWQAETTTEQLPSSVASESTKRRVVASTVVPAKVISAPADNMPQDILIVVSKLKKYIKERSGLRTSDTCVDALSDHVRTLCDRAIENARNSERQTVLDRDFDGVL